MYKMRQSCSLTFRPAAAHKQCVAVIHPADDRLQLEPCLLRHVLKEDLKIQRLDLNCQIISLNHMTHTLWAERAGVCMDREVRYVFPTIVCGGGDQLSLMDLTIKCDP